jgi:hypothetical protein
MSSPTRFAPWFWLLLGTGSLIGSYVEWTAQRRATDRPAVRSTAALRASDLPAPVSPAVPGSDARAADPPAQDAPAPDPAAAPAVVVVPRILAPEPSGATRVLRCVVRGRVTYVDASAACPNGSAGRIKVVPH